MNLGKPFEKVTFKLKPEAYIGVSQLKSKKSIPGGGREERGRKRIKVGRRGRGRS